MKHLKSNAPLILLLALVPYFYYNSPSLAQALIVVSVATLVALSTYLEHNSQPDYKKLFQDDIKKRDEAIKLHISDLIKELEELREKQSMGVLVEATKKKRDSITW